MGADAAFAQFGDNIWRGLAFNSETNQTLARGVVETTNNVDLRHILQALDIANAVDHGIRETFFMGVDCLAGYHDPRAWVGLVRNFTAQPNEIIHHIGKGHISALSETFEKIIENRFILIYDIDVMTPMS